MSWLGRRAARGQQTANVEQFAVRLGREYGLLEMFL